MPAEPAPILRFPEGVREGPFVFTPTGLAVTGSPSYEQWHGAGFQLKTLYRGILWIIGDWLILGEKLFGQEHTQGLDDLGYDYSTLRNARRTALQIEAGRRRPALSFDHHLAVSSLPVIAQESLLDRAVANGWTRDQLRKAVREHQLDKRRQEAKGTAPEVLPLPGEAGSDSTPQAVNLLAGRFQDIMPRLPQASVDLIITRPPQAGEDVQVFGDLAKNTERVLAPQGSLIVQAPISHLRECVRLCESYLRFWWILASESPGGYLEGLGVSCSWRPWVWLVKGGRRGDGTVKDLLPADPIRYLVERLTVEGEVILDPCCGTGEVLSAAHGLNRALIGVDPDPANIDIAKRRLGGG
jgi:hypothetical protein